MARARIACLALVLAGCGSAASPSPSPAATPCIDRAIVSHRGAFAGEAAQAAAALQAGDMDALLREFRLMASEARSEADALLAARPDLAAHLSRAADALDKAATANAAGNLGDANSWLSQALAEQQQGLAGYSEAALCL